MHFFNEIQASKMCINVEIRCSILHLVSLHVVGVVMQLVSCVDEIFCLYHNKACDVMHIS